MQSQQLALLFRAIPNSLLANLFGCLVAILIFTSQVEPANLYAWVLLMLSVSFLRYLNFRQYLRASELDDLEHWYVKFRIGSLLQAFALGSSGFLLFDYEDSSY